MTLKNLNQYGPHFQIKVLSSLLTHKEFLVNIQDILSDEYFDNQAHKWIIKEVLRYYDKYHTTPSMDILKVEVKKIDNEVLQLAVKEQLREAYQASEEDLEYVQEEFTGFCKNQQIKKALMSSVDLLKAGDFDSINKLDIKSAKYINTPDQSKTDFKKSLEWIVKQKLTEVNIFGLSGKSDDHFLGNLYTCNEFSHLLKLKAFTDTSIITPCIGKNKFNSFKNQKVSLFVLENSSIVTSINLEFVLKNFELFPTNDAIRNISMGDTFCIESSSKILVFQSVN